MLFGFSVLKAQNENEIKSTIQNMFETVFSTTFEKSIEKYFTDDIIIFEDGEIYNMDALRTMTKELGISFEKEISNGHSLVRKNDFEFLKVIDEGDSAFIYYINSADFIYDGTSIAKISWLESAKLKKINNEWKITFLHSTKINNKQKNQ